jgi:hypothetical protein
MMIDEYILNYILLYVLLESYEIWWQKAETLLGILARMYEQYRQSAWLFLLMQPTFYFSIMFMMLSDYNIYSVIFFSMKASDVLTKMFLIKRVFLEKQVSHELSQMLVTPINKIFLYLGLVIYPALIFFSLS